MNRYWVRFSWLTVIVLLGAAASWSQPKIEFRETVKDFGESAPMQDLHHNFEFKNAGSEPLVLSDVHTSCGCTAAVLSATTVAVGATNIISVTMHTGLASPMQKYVTVESNDPDNGVINLELRAVIKKVWTFSPQESFNFGDVLFNTETSQQLTLINQGTEPRKILSTKVNNPAFSVSVGEPQENKIPVTLAVKSGPEEKVLMDMLVIQTDDPDQPIVQVPVNARVVGPVRFSPQKLFFGTVKKGSQVTREVIATVADEKLKADFQVASVETDLGLVQGEVVEKRMDGSVRLRFTFTAPDATGFKQGKVLVKSTNSDLPPSTLNFSAIVRP